MSQIKKNDSLANLFVDDDGDVSSDFDGEPLFESQAQREARQRRITADSPVVFADGEAKITSPEDYTDRCFEFLSEQSGNRDFRRRMRGIWRDVCACAKFTCSLPVNLANAGFRSIQDFTKRGFHFALRWMLQGFGDPGNLVVLALEKASWLRDCLDRDWKKDFERFIEFSLFDIVALGVHLATSNTLGKIFSCFEFIWRQLGSYLKVSALTFWNDFVIPTFNRLFSGNANNGNIANAPQTPTEGFGVVAALVGSVLNGQNVANGVSTSTLTRWANYGRDLANLDRGANCMWKLIQQFVDLIKQAVMYFCPSFEFGMRDRDILLASGINLDSYLALSKKFSNPLLREALAVELSTQLEVQQWLNLDYAIQRTLLKEDCKVSTSTRMGLQQSQIQVRKFIDYFLRYRVPKLERRCPYVVQFSGEPGTGKSAAMFAVADAIPKICDALAKRDPERIGAFPNGEDQFEYDQQGNVLIYNKSSVTKHDDGFNPRQKVLMWDDAFAGRGETAADSDAAWFIRAISSAQCSMNMAALEDKGLFFTGKLVVMSSQEAHPAFTEIRCNQAVWRRRNVLIWVSKNKVGGGKTYRCMNPMGNEASDNVFQGRTYTDLNALIQDIAEDAFKWFNQPLFADGCLNEEARETIINNLANRANALEDTMEEGVLEESSVYPIYVQDRARYFGEPSRHPVALGLCRGPYRRGEWGDLLYDSMELTCSCCSEMGCPCYGNILCAEGVEFDSRWKNLDMALRSLNGYYCYRCDQFTGVWDMSLAHHAQNWWTMDPNVQELYHMAYELSPQLRHQMEVALKFAPQYVITRWLEGNMSEPWNYVMMLDFQDRLDAVHEHGNYAEEFVVGQNLANAIDEDDLPPHPNRVLTMRERLTSGIEGGGPSPVQILEELAGRPDTLTWWERFTRFIDEVRIWSKDKTKRGYSRLVNYLRSIGQTNWPRFFRNLNEALLDLLRLGIVILSFIGMACLTWNIWKTVVGSNLANAGQGPSGGDAQSSRRARMRLHRAKVNAVEEATTLIKERLQSEGFESEAEQIVQKMDKIVFDFEKQYDTPSWRYLDKHMVLMRYKKDNGNYFRIQGLGIRGNVCLTSWHWAKQLVKEAREVEVWKGGLWKTTHVGPNEIRRLIDYNQPENERQTDLAFVCLGARTFQFKDLLERKQFVLYDELPDLHARRAEIPSYHEDDMLKNGIVNVQTFLNTKIEYHDEEETFYLPKAIQYEGVGNSVYCGAPLVKTGPVHHGSIFGIHSAKNTRNGISWAWPVYEELIAENLKHFSNNNGVSALCDTPDFWSGTVLGVPTKEIATFDLDSPLTVVPEGNMEYVATLKPGWVERVCNKTNIAPSPIHGVFDVETEPSVKYGKDPRIREELRNDPHFTPLNEGAKKYSVPCKPFNAVALELATRFVMMSLAMIRPVTDIARLLTEQEMINGVKHWGYTRLNMLSSAGWPHKRLRKGECMTKGKRFLFSLVEGCEDTYEIANLWLRRDVDAYEKNLRTSRRTFLVTYSNLKDERRSLQKIRDGKTRLFDCMPLPHTLMVRKYFGAWVAAVNNQCLTSYSAIGIDCNGPDWTMLFRRLNSNGGRVIAGDFADWDGKLDANVMMRAVKCINYWYRKHGGACWNPQDDIAREILINDCIRSYTIYGNTVVFKDQGLPSGMAITADLNSLCNFLYMVCAFYSLRGAQVDATPEDFERVFYGDDHILAPKPKIHSWFNFNTLQNYFAQHGIVYTDALKRGGLQSDFIELEGEATFLKRRFIRHYDHRQLILAPIEKRTITELANWVQRSGQPWEMLELNLSDLFEFAYHHGKQFYDETRDKIEATLLNAVMQGKTSSFKIPEEFESVDAAWLKKHFGE